MTATAQSPRAWFARPGVWLTGLLIAGGVVLALPNDDRVIAPETALEAATPMRVTVVAAGPMEFSRGLDLTGLLAAREDVAIGTAIAGQRITEVLVEVGDTVAAGELLARLETGMLAAQVTRAEAAVAQGRATLAQALAADDAARTDLGRLQRLLQTNAVSAKDVDAARAAARGTAAAVARAEAELLGLEAELGDSRAELAKADIRAPVAGAISARTARVGVLADAATPLFQLIQDGEVELLADVPESALGLLAVGQPVSLTVNGVVREVEGRIRLIEPTIDPQSRMATVRISLPPASDLRPGAFARGRVDLGTWTFALTVPETALRQRNGAEAAVMVVDVGGMVASRGVTIGEARDGIAEVLTGLQAGERVVRNASAFLDEGDVVTPVAHDQTASAATP
jgi:HlyD family secretion protein